MTGEVEFGQRAAAEFVWLNPACVSCDILQLPYQTTKFIMELFNLLHRFDNIPLYLSGSYVLPSYAVVV